jgi:BolA protein
MSVAERLGSELRRRLAPAHLDIVDFSAAHAGHAGARPEGETHFDVTVVAEAFSGRSRLERQRLVLDAAGELLEGTIHALTITALTPAEWAAREDAA